MTQGIRDAMSGEEFHRVGEVTPSFKLLMLNVINKKYLDFLMRFQCKPIGRSPEWIYFNFM